MRISDWSSDVCSSDLEEIFATSLGLFRSGGWGLLMLAGYDEFLFEQLLHSNEKQGHEEDRKNGCGDHAAHDASSNCILPAGARPACHRKGQNAEDEGERRHRSGRAHSELQSLMRNSYAVFCLK